MVASHLLDLPAAYAVRAAVADVPDVHLFLPRAEQATDHRGAHAVVFTGARAAIDDLTVGDANARQEAILFFRQARVEVEWPGEIFGRGRAKKVDDGLG